MSIFLISIIMQISTVDGYHQEYTSEVYIQEFYEQTFFIDSGAKIEFFNGFIYGNLNARLPMYKCKNVYFFYPLNLSSYIEVGLNYKEFSIGVKHICIHPISVLVTPDIDMNFSDSFYNEFFIRIESNIIGF